MDIYEQTQHYLSNIPALRKWPAMQTLLQTQISTRPGCWQIPLMTNLAVGGVEGVEVPAVAAVASCQTAIILVDDLLDGDGRTDSLEWSHGETANLATAFQSLGFECIIQSPYPGDIQRRMLMLLNQMILDTAAGQAADLIPPQTESAYWQTAQAKSSPFFSALFEIGAISNGTDELICHSIGNLGRLYGEMIQVSDDLHDVIENPASTDWGDMRNPLPLLFAQVVDHPWRDRFLELRRNIEQPGALAECQTILIRCGAISYCIDQLMKRYQTALDWVKEAGLPNSAVIESEFTRFMEPIWSLLYQTETEARST